MNRHTLLLVARHRAAIYRDMLPTFDQVNDKQNGFTQADMDVLLHETDQMVPVSAADLRLHMVVQLRTYHRRYIDAITGRARGEADKTAMLVADITRGWEQYRIQMPDPDVRGDSPLQDWVEGLLGKDGVRRVEPKDGRQG